MKLLDAYPTARLGGLLRATASGDADLARFDALYASGTEAVYRAFRALALPAGTPVWMPAFHCGVEVQAAIDAGHTPRFYGVSADLRADVQALEAGLATDPGPVLVIHYLGFPQRALPAVAALCQRHAVPLIEDCAHALWTTVEGQPLGATGSYGVFSLRKFLGVVDGGALIAGPNAPPPRRDLPPARGTARLARELMRETVGSALTGWYRRLRFGRSTPAAAGVVAAMPDYGQTMSGASRRLARGTDTVAAQRRRRANYRTLVELIDAPDVEVVFPDLPEGVTPLVCPVRVANRAAVLDRLSQAAVRPYVFGERAHASLPNGAFPDAAQLRDRLLGLPVQQELVTADMRRVAAALVPESDRTGHHPPPHAESTTMTEAT